MRGQLLLEHVSGQLQRGRPEERRGVPAFRAWRGLPQLGGQQTAGAEDLDQGRTGPARDDAQSDRAVADIDVQPLQPLGTPQQALARSVLPDLDSRQFDELTRNRLHNSCNQNLSRALVSISGPGGCPVFVGDRAPARPPFVGEATHQWMLTYVARLRPGFARVSRVGDTVSDWTTALCILCSLVPIPIIGEPKDGGWRNRARPEQRRW